MLPQKMSCKVEGKPIQIHFKNEKKEGKKTNSNNNNTNNLFAKCNANHKKIYKNQYKNNTATRHSHRSP